MVLTIRKVKVKNIYFNVYTQIKRDMEVVIVIRFDLVKVFTSGCKNSLDSTYNTMKFHNPTFMYSVNVFKNVN